MEKNVFITTISKGLNCQLKDLISCYIYEITEKENKIVMRKKNSIACICKDRILIVSENLSEIMVSITYPNIMKIETDPENSSDVMIMYKNFDQPNNYVSDQSFHLSFNKIRTIFINSLMTNYGMYYIEERAVVKDLPLHTSGKLITKSNKRNIEFCFEPHISEGCEKYSYKDYSFYIKGNRKQLSENRFLLTTQKDGDLLEVQLNLFISDTKLIDELVVKPDIKDIGYYAFNHFNHYMINVEKGVKYAILHNSNYNKKFNFFHDNSQWEGWRIECRVFEVKEIRTEEEVEKKGKKEKKKEILQNKKNMIFIYLRRKYIPILYDTYIDMVAIISEPFDEAKEIEISSDSINIIETLVDTIFANDSLNHECKISDKINSLLEARLDSLQLDVDSIDYFFHTLGIRGNMYRFGLEYVFKVVLVLDEYVRDKYVDIRSYLKNKIDIYLTASDKYFDIEQYTKKVRNMEFDIIIEEIESFLYNLVPQAQIEKFLPIWREKIWKFLAYCINGGLTNGLLGMEEIILLNKRLNCGLSKQINNLLNISIRGITVEFLEPKLSTLVSSLNEVKSFILNEDIFLIQLKIGNLHIVQGLDEEFFINFIRIYLENYISNKFLHILASNLSDLSSTNESNTGSSATLRKAYTNLIPTLINIYSNTKLCPSTLAIVGKILCLLTSTTHDKTNKKRMIEEDIFLSINQHLNSPFEKLVFYTLSLTLNILAEAKEILSDVLIKNHKILFKLLNIIMGTGIPEVFYSTKIISKVLDILNTFIIIPNSQIKEKVSHKKYRIFLKFLFNYIQSNQFRGPKDLEESIIVQEKIFILLRMLIKRNSDLKSYISHSLNFVKVIEIKSAEIRDFVDLILNNYTESQKTYGSMVDNTLRMLKEMLNFILDYLGNDMELIKLISCYGHDFIQLNSIVYEKTLKEKHDIMYEIGIFSKGIYKTLFCEKVNKKDFDSNFDIFKEPTVTEMVNEYYEEN